MPGRYYMSLESGENTGMIYAPDGSEYLSVGTTDCESWTQEQEDRVAKIVDLLNEKN